MTLDEAKKETENASRRRQALQDHRDRQDRSDALRQAPLYRHQEAGSYAQAQEIDARESGRCSCNQADDALRPLDFALNFSVILSLVFTELSRNIAGRKLRNRARQRFTGACRPM